ncbi:MAG: response regulator transcription factor [Actinobacteria bacterium]|nr:response regulator transcription factor [Actinomycetota bacterium]MDI6831731.1 response regulator transcription factor [Actinomycetota bacterium]
MRILVVEDDEKIARFIRKGLTEEGYAVDVARNGEEALSFATSAPYDLIILDLLIPRIDGITVCRRLRESNLSVSILILTAKDSIEDRVTGLDAGADDYLVKPFAFAELLARIRALMRRPQSATSNILQISDLVLDLNKHRAERSGALIELTSTEYALLEYLMRNPCQVLTRTQIMQHVWDYDFYGGSNIVDVYICYLRKKIDEAHDKKLIKTIRGTGYTLCEDS